MGVIIWGISVLLVPFFGMSGLRWLALLALIGTGIVSYFGIGHLIGAFHLSEFRASLRR